MLTEAAISAIMLVILPAAASATDGDRPRHIAEPAKATGQRILGAPVYQKTFVSPRYEIDGIYRSMKGPLARDLVALGEPEAGLELLWITANHTEIVSSDATGPSSPEFMCHSNLSFQGQKKHAQVFGSRPRARLFTLSQGAMEVRFPEGFGIPVASKQALELATQVLNLNEQPETIGVRHRVTVEYVRQSELETPMKPLVVLNAQGFKAVDEHARHFGEAHANAEDHGPGCSVGEPAAEHTFKDGIGGRFIAHWVVEPGREENRTLVTNWMRIPFDTTVHFVSVHLHPFAESASLMDLTTNQLVYHSAASGPSDQIGLTSVESYNSNEGFPIYRDHEYELSSVYQNTSNEDQDSMAVMFLYALDKDFRLPPDMAAQ